MGLPKRVSMTRPCWRSWLILIGLAVAPYTIVSPRIQHSPSTMARLPPLVIDNGTGYTKMGSVCVYRHTIYGASLTFLSYQFRREPGTLVRLPNRDRHTRRFIHFRRQIHHLDRTRGVPTGRCTSRRQQARTPRFQAWD